MLRCYDSVIAEHIQYSALLKISLGCIVLSRVDRVDRLASGWTKPRPQLSLAPRHPAPSLSSVTYLSLQPRDQRKPI